MKFAYRRLFVTILFFCLIGIMVSPLPVASQEDAPDPFDLVSQESLFNYLEDLTSIQPYSGWRNSATEGEAEAMDYVATTLGDFAYFDGPTSCDSDNVVEVTVVVWESGSGAGI